ncbi:hypothetical protein Patl1_20648 [Pistacia atlantica]|uniref:Uncharacterized protein n=1 Tax=Pistacia atlantica TaxID=434234 RepID=A0ACC1BMJ4_9ROSI|nr:hypothetical protein Patl1_20648 [Pistacia atlantica]
MIQAYKVQTANAMVEYPSIKQISLAKWHIIAIEVPQGLVFLDMSNKQDICRDINPSNIQLDGTSLLPHSPSNSRSRERHGCRWLHRFGNLSCFTRLREERFGNKKESTEEEAFES